MKTIIGMPRWMFWTLLAAVLLTFTPLLAPLMYGNEEPIRIANGHVYKLVAQGNDTEVKTDAFTVGKHWKVTCTASKVGPDFAVQIFAVPSAGTHNLEVLNMTSEGTQTTYVRDGGSWKLHIIGFSAAFNVTVEESD